MTQDVHSRRTGADGGSPLSAFDTAFLQRFDAKEAERQRRPASRECWRRENNERSLAFEADQQRRRALGREGIIAEDGEAFSSAIENMPEATLVLQVNRQATCARFGVVHEIASKLTPIAEATVTSKRNIAWQSF